MLCSHGSCHAAHTEIKLIYNSAEGRAAASDNNLTHSDVNTTHRNFTADQSISASSTGTWEIKCAEISPVSSVTTLLPSPSPPPPLRSHSPHDGWEVSHFHRRKKEQTVQHGSSEKKKNKQRASSVRNFQEDLPPACSRTQWSTAEGVRARFLHLSLRPSVCPRSEALRLFPAHSGTRAEDPVDNVLVWRVCGAQRFIQSFIM